MTECVEFTGYIDPTTGYGNVNTKTATGWRPVTAQRVAWAAVHGPIPEGRMHVDHLCRNRRCINVDHLELVTERENILRGTAPSAMNARKTHCVRGHDLAAAKIRANGGRRCVTCSRQDAANVRARKRGA